MCRPVAFSSAVLTVVEFTWKDLSLWLHILLCCGQSVLKNPRERGFKDGEIVKVNTIMCYCGFLVVWQKYRAEWKAAIRGIRCRQLPLPDRT